MRPQYLKQFTQADLAVTLVVAGYVCLLLAAITFFIIPGIGLILFIPAPALFLAAFVVWRQRHRSSN